MTAEYITLANGRRVRVFWNMNALGEFTRITGKEMTDLADGKADISTLRTIAWCSAVEGERLDGKELGLTEIEMGGLMSMQCIVAFSGILTAQSGVADQQKKSQSPGRFPQILFRRKA